MPVKYKDGRVEGREAGGENVSGREGRAKEVSRPVVEGREGRERGGRELVEGRQRRVRGRGG